VAQVQVGVLGGYSNSYSTYKGDRFDYAYTETPSNIEGKHLFLQLRTRSSKKAKIVVEAGYIERGTTYVDPRAFCPYAKELHLNYLSVGGHVEYRLLQLGKLRLDALGGLNTSYLASSFVTVFDRQSSRGTNSKYDLRPEEEDRLRRILLGVNAGSVLSLNFGDTQLQARATYYLGVNQIAKNYGLKSRSVSLSFGIARTIRWPSRVSVFRSKFPPKPPHKPGA
jgi:hypothetical protein